MIRQSERFELYRAEIERLRRADRVYECFCTRREIRAEIEGASQAPHQHLPDGAYPGTCRELDAEDRQRKRDSGRSPALRLRADAEIRTVVDGVAGSWTGAVDDVVLARADGVPAYNLAVVVDDAAQGIGQVVRGDDLLSSTPRQILLQDLLGLPRPEYLHIGLVVDETGGRIAKRTGGVTVAELRADGWTGQDILTALARSLALIDKDERADVNTLTERFDASAIPRGPVDYRRVLGQMAI